MVKQWQILASRHIADTKLFNLESRLIQAEQKSPTEVVVLEAPDWVNVVAVTDEGRVVLIEQYRHGIQLITLEIPGGVVDPGETPQNAAERELLEETGYSARDWTLLGTVRPNPAFLSNSCYTYLAGGAHRLQDQHLDPGEDISVLEVPLTDIPNLLACGRIDHALVVAGFLWYWLRLPLKIEDRK
jgi:8-oxo-dGTP pyrophosphatase MutT (NUDIX family)